MQFNDLNPDFEIAALHRLTGPIEASPVAECTMSDIKMNAQCNTLLLSIELSRERFDSGNEANRGMAAGVDFGDGGVGHDEEMCLKQL
jgi:hypothetical protein